MLNAAGLAFVVAGARWGQPDGQVMFLFILAMAAAEVSVGLALVLQLYHRYQIAGCRRGQRDERIADAQTCSGWFRRSRSPASWCWRSWLAASREGCRAMLGVGSIAVSAVIAILISAGASWSRPRRQCVHASALDVDRCRRLPPADRLLPRRAVAGHDAGGHFRQLPHSPVFRRIHDRETRATAVSSPT